MFSVALQHVCADRNNPVSIFYLIQFYYTIHVNYNFMWNTQILVYLRDFVQYFQVNFLYFSSIGSSIYLAIFFVVFAVVLILTVSIAATVYVLNQGKKKSSTFLSYAVKFISLNALLETTVLTIPFFNIFIGTIYCTNTSPIAQSGQCYSGMNFLPLGLGLLGLILFLGLLTMFSTLFIELKYLFILD